MTQIEITEWSYWARSSARAGAGAWAVACASARAGVREYKLVDIGDLIHDSN